MNEQLTALYHAVNVLMARIGEHGHAGTRDPETSAVMDALAAIDGGQYKPDLSIAALGQGEAVPRAWLYTYPHDGESDHCISIPRLLARWIRSKGAIETPLYTHAPHPVVPDAKVPVPSDVMEARAQGRAEALAIILGLDPEEGLDEYTHSIPPGPSGEWGAAWDQEKLRELLRADDNAWSLLQEAEGEYWHQLGLREEAERLSAKAAAPTPEAQPQGAGSECCSACNGSGEVLGLLAAHDPQDSYEATVACPDCDGVGEWPRNPKASEAGQGVALNYAVVHKFAVDHGIDYNTLAKLVRDSVVATHTQEGR